MKAEKGSKSAPAKVDASGAPVYDHGRSVGERRSARVEVQIDNGACDADDLRHCGATGPVDRVEIPGRSIGGLATPGYMISDRARMTLTAMCKPAPTDPVITNRRTFWENRRLRSLGV